MIHPNDGTADALARAVAGAFTIEREIERGGVPRFIQIPLALRNGRTTFRAFDDVSQHAGGMFAGLGGGLEQMETLMQRVIARARDSITSG